MKPTYRNVAIAASGVLVAAVAANIVRSRQRDHRKIAQTMTVLLDRQTVAEALADDAVFRQAIDCDIVNIRRDEAMHIYEWTCAAHGDSHGARLALINAPGDRGTELHLVMNDRKYNVKEVIRRLKYLLETGEIPTGARTA
jgi:hypothetical protein